MLPFKRTFDSEKQQLQELNSRLAQYLSRTQQLEQENALLITEISHLKQVKKTPEWQQNYRAEMHDLRRMVEQLSFEKSQAELEREKLWRELQTVQSACSEQTEACRDMSGELQSCAQELQQAHKINGELQQRLLQLQDECKRLEEAHRRDLHHLHRQVDSRVAPFLTQTHRGAPVVSVEEVQKYARGLSEGWIETFEMYQRKVEEMERAIQEDQARLSDMKTEKMMYSSELGKLRTETQRQAQTQRRLEEQLMAMQQKFQLEFNEHQMIIEQLEHERNSLADAMAEKMREHQHLLQVKMDLGMEVAAYRALLENEKNGLQDAHKRINRPQRERIIDIKVPAQTYTPRTSLLTSSQRTDIKYTSPMNLRRSPKVPSGSVSPPRVVPFSLVGKARHQSPASRRDMISFNKAQAAASIPSAPPTLTVKDKQTGRIEKEEDRNVQKTAGEQETGLFKPDSEDKRISHTAETKSVRVVSAPAMILGAKKEAESKKQVLEKNERGSVHDTFREKDQAETATGPTEKKILDAVSVEEIIEKVIKPAGLEAKVCSSGDSKVTYHVEKSEEDDGRTKTQIVLESKVEEELDISADSALEELLSHGVKKVSLESMDDTATASMIKSLISSIQGGQNLQNRSVNVEIIEEPMESYSDEEAAVEQKSKPSFYEPSTYFHIEELEHVPHDVREERLSDDGKKSSFSTTDWSSRRSVQAHEVPREDGSPHFSHVQEYFVSTPDENFSEPEGGGITSYGHYGVVDDLSDERYYQDESIPQRRVIVEESDESKYTSGDGSFGKESFPECIIEEEVRVSPEVQESFLEFLREDSLEPKEQLKGALEKLQTSVSGPLREELAFLTKVSSASPQNVAIKKVEQSADNGTVTVIAELNVSQTLEDSGLLDSEDVSEEQIMEALRSSNLALEKSLGGGAGGGYSIKVFEEREHVGGDDFKGFSEERKLTSEMIEKHVKLGLPEKSFTFQMDVESSCAETSSDKELQFETMETPEKISHEKKVATLYLEGPSEN
uniref:Synemin, intermediate filament protein n=1 Tax=Oryzias sinensis TaxID=183150 RepID=A0A8C7YHN1_9TELE